MNQRQIVDEVTKRIVKGTKAGGRGSRMVDAGIKRTMAGLHDIERGMKQIQQEKPGRGRQLEYTWGGGFVRRIHEELVNLRREIARDLAKP